MVTLSRRLGKLVSTLDYDRLPTTVVEQTKKCLMDFLGVALAGSNTRFGHTLASLMKNTGGIKESTIIGNGARIPCTSAAFVNAALAHIHELDDGHRFAMGHPGAPTIPAALSLAEKLDVDGKHLITSIVCGYEVFCRIACAINPSHLSRGFHTTGTCGTFAAAAAAGKILGLGESSIANALSIAGTQASGLMEVMRGESVIKPIQPGRAAQSGVFAGLLANEGVSAPDSILEGQNGFCRAMSDNCNLEYMIKDLNNDYEIMRVYFKFHAACRHIHPSIDATLEILNSYDLTYQNIEKIWIRTYSIAYNLCGRANLPKTTSTAKFSLPFCVSTAVVERKVDHNSFTNEKIKDPRILSLAKRVQVQVDPEIDGMVPRERGSKVILETKTGRRYECYVRNPYGEPEVPASLEDLEAKFKNLSTQTISSNKTEELLLLISQLEKLKSMREILRCV